MKPRIAVRTVVALAAWLPVATMTALTSSANASKATNPPYLSQFPPVERVQAEITGTDEMDTAARQMGAFWQLLQVIQELAGQRFYRNQLTPDENRIMGQYRLGYSTAEKPYAHIQNSPSHPDKPKWYQMHAFYETDPGFLDEVLQKFLSAEFRDAYYKATGKQPPSKPTPSQPANPQPSQPTKTPPSASAGGSAEDYFAQGDKYLKAKNYTAAVEAYKKSISLRPSANAYDGLGLTYLAMEQPENAVVAFQQAVRLEPNSASVQLDLGLAYMKMKQYENAIAPLRAAVRLKPDYPIAFNLLGNSYAKSEQLLEAVVAYQQAIRLDPKDAIYHDNLGHTYVQMGKKEEALEVH
ncbi:MAG: tetratricopeptide repeat protein, partial [Armatimonadota bacterium]|nr:tetratricopeptide repeat protein [Armatimonadota bacterium]